MNCKSIRFAHNDDTGKVLGNYLVVIIYLNLKKMPRTNSSQQDVCILCNPRSLPTVFRKRGQSAPLRNQQSIRQSHPHKPASQTLARYPPHYSITPQGCIDRHHCPDANPSRPSVWCRRCLAPRRGGMQVRPSTHLRSWRGILPSVRGDTRGLEIRYKPRSTR